MEKILSKKEPERKLKVMLKKKSGRSSSGRISIRHRGGGVKRFYRIIDFGQEKLNIPIKVLAIEYDPNRTSFIALVEYPDKEKRYILAPKDLKAGDEIIFSESADLRAGNRMKLKNIPVGTQVHNIELGCGEGGKLIRGAGTSAEVVTQEEGFTHLKMPSGEIRKISQGCFASIGQVSNIEKKFRIIGKAGTKRLMGWRPTVRGTVMNPCDHPHGGGEGKTTTGLKYQKTPWGKHAMGVRTRKKKWTDKLIISRRKR